MQFVLCVGCSIHDDDAMCVSCIGVLHSECGVMDVIWMCG